MYGRRYPVVRTGDEEEEEGEAAAGAKGPVVVEKTSRGKFSRPAVPLSSS